MRLLYVGYLTRHRGGGPLSAALLLSALAEKGCSVRALELDVPQRPAAAPRSVAVPGVASAGIVTLPIFEPSPGDNPSLELRRREADVVLPALERELDRTPPDAVLIGFETPVHYVPAAARARGVPCLARMTGSYATRIIDGSQSAEVADDWIREIRRVDRVVCVTSLMADGLIRLGVRNVRVIPNGVNLQHFQPRPPDAALRRRLDLPDDARVILHPSNLKAVKRCLDLVAAAPRLLDREPRCYFVLLGSGPDGEALRAAVDAAGLRDRFRFPGWVGNDRTPAFYSLADVVVMPSEREGQSRVYLESQACGVPLAASDIPAARVVITDGETGVLFRKGDPADLADRLAVLLSDRERRAAISARALDQVRRRHGLDRVVSLYHAELEEMASLRA